MAGVTVNRKREKPVANVTLSTPYGSNIVVSAQRAKTLLNRPAVRLGDGKLRQYVEGEDKDTLVSEETSGAKAPRTGARANTTEGGA